MEDGVCFAVGTVPLTRQPRPMRPAPRKADAVWEAFAFKVDSLRAAGIRVIELNPADVPRWSGA
jgi:hypothetical protein